MAKLHDMKDSIKFGNREPGPPKRVGRQLIPLVVNLLRMFARTLPLPLIVRLASLSFFETENSSMAVSTESNSGKILDQKLKK